MSFADLKRKSQTDFSVLTKELEKANSTSSGDDRFWKPSVDAAGNGFAVIRFLPAPDGEEIPFVKLYSHAFQGDGGWYIENSLTTLGGKDPVGEVNRKLWNSGRDSDKEIARKQKRKLTYYANIFVVSDKANPENEGKVFLYKFGKKIFDKVTAAMSPEFEDETPMNPFDLWEGANFKLKIRKVDGYWNYDKSEFDAPGPLLDDDDAMEAIWKKESSLAEVVSPSQFKSYEQLGTRLKMVFGQKSSPRQNFDEEVENEDNDRGSYTPDFSSRRPEPELPQVTPSFDEDDDTLSYFQRLAE